MVGADAVFHFGDTKRERYGGGAIQRQDESVSGCDGITEWGSARIRKRIDTG
jgi:hypothetical protein